MMPNNNQEKLKLLQPLVLAPMAGGPSTPGLCVAVAEAGGLPFLAAGYLTPQGLKDQITEVEQKTSAPYGVNLFMPMPKGKPGDLEVYRAYRQRIIETCDVDVQMLPDEPRWSDDDFHEKLDIVLASSARFVSFVFDHPTPSVIERVHLARKLAVTYSTSRPGISAIAASDADVVGIQGSAAGGHQATVAGVDDEETTDTLVNLVGYARSICSKPIFAGGGIASADDVDKVLKAGATAVQVGTMFLNAHEAGTKATHRRALRELRDRETVMTTAFTGRPARAIVNSFTKQFEAIAPPMFPQVHYLTAALRKQADTRGDMENLHLWAGTGFRNATSEPAAAIMQKLLRLSRAAPLH